MAKLEKVPEVAVDAIARAMCIRDGFDPDSPQYGNGKPKWMLWRSFATEAALAVINAWPDRDFEYNSDHPRFYNGDLIIMPLDGEYEVGDA